MIEDSQACRSHGLSVSKPIIALEYEADPAADSSELHTLANSRTLPEFDRMSYTGHHNHSVIRSRCMQ